MTPLVGARLFCVELAQYTKSRQKPVKMYMLIKSKYFLPCLLAHNRKKTCTFISLPSSKVISLSIENNRFCPVKGVLHEKMDSSGSLTLVSVGLNGGRFFLRCNCSSPTATTTRRSQHRSRSRAAERILRTGTLASEDWHRR